MPAEKLTKCTADPGIKFESALFLAIEKEPNEANHYYYRIRVEQEKQQHPG